MSDQQQPVFHLLHRAVLKRRDVLAFEPQLLCLIRSFISFEGHSISFPRDKKKRSIKWLTEEKKLLLPLFDNKQQTLCVFVANQVEEKSVASLIEHWDAIGLLIVHNLLLYKQSLCDPVTGLYSRHLMLHFLEQEITRLRNPLAIDDSKSEVDFYNPWNSLALQHTGALGRGSCAIFIIRLTALRDVVREFGYQFADSLIIALADALKASCPDQGLTARTGDLELALLLPAASHKTCQKLGEAIALTLQNVTIHHPLRKEDVSIISHIGYALYPQDMHGNAYLQPNLEQANLLLRKARLAAALAGEGLSWQGHTLPFARILAEGGKILDVLPLSRVTVSLGSNMHAREGLRFSVWSTNYPSVSEKQYKKNLAPMYKGEIVLMEVQENTSSAEVLHLGDPSWQIEPNDRLTLISEEQKNSAPFASCAVDPITGLYRYGDFMAKWVEEREKHAVFCLSLLRLTPKKEHEAFIPSSTDMEGWLAQAASLCHDFFSASFIGGRYGLTSLIFYHGDHTFTEIAKSYENLVQEINNRLPVTATVGIAHYPFIDFRKTDTLENCQKSLEYALLLPPPHIGILDSLALNIAADKLYSHGDTFGAIREYQKTLLADDNNCIAWNSLGICLAGVGKLAEAETCFEEAFRRDSKDSMTLYNLGYIHQTQGNEQKAKVCYTACLKEAPDHLFSLIRLGQLAEGEEDTEKARYFYEKAATLPGGKGVTCRHFARLCIKEGTPEKAREFLHEALVYDPQDAFAMQLIAKLFLDAGEDPDLAASFARQSVSLCPQLKPGWLELARSLEAMGEHAQAKEALLRASKI